jgi:hypothetical protein
LIELSTELTPEIAARVPELVALVVAELTERGCTPTVKSTNHA